MAKTKTHSHSRNKSAAKGDSVLHSPNARIKSKNAPRPIEDLLTEAASLLEQSQPDLALPLAEEALRRLEAERAQPQGVASIDSLLQLAAQGKATLPTALTVAADIQLAAGNVEAARTRFEKAVQIDPDGALVSADPLLWLAQLCEDGGKTSISYFDKGCDVLRNEIEVLQESVRTEDQDEEGERVLDERRAKLAEALCGMAEVYMTDLSWEEDAEARCEAYVTEAIAICPERLGAGTLQTLASIRISQQRTEDAREALRRSVSLWKDIPAEVEDDARPDFATRVSLARLLMEVQAEAEALEVLEWLVREDDESVECWYLGGCLAAPKRHIVDKFNYKFGRDGLVMCPKRHYWCLRTTSDDKYGRTDFIPDDGSIRTHSRLQRSPDDSSSQSSSHKQNFDSQSTKGLLTADAAKSGSDGSLELPSRRPVPPPKTGLLAPTAPGGRASVVSNASSTGAAFRKSNDYLGAYIRGGINKNASESSKEAESAAPSIELEAGETTEKDTRSPPSVVVSHDEDAWPQRPERPADMVNVIDSQGHIKDGGWKHESQVSNNTQQAPQPLHTGAPAQQPAAGHESIYELPDSRESFPAYESQPRDGYNSQYWEAQAPGAHVDHHGDEEDYYDPGEDYGDPYDYEDYNSDPRWLPMGMRPLPPDDPSENPEQRANRIRSFYKEYFDESSKGANRGLDGAYYEDQGRAPPPKALNMIPTPSKLKDDTFIIDQSIDFAPPLRAVMQRSGTPDSGQGGSVPFSPTVRAHVPLVSSYDDLAVMPSPHLLRKSGTFTALDFAPPRFRPHDSFSDSGSIRSARSGTSLSTQRAIKAGAYRVSRIPKEVVGTHGEMGSSLKPQWDMNR
ncbi:hypothetical protein DV737_g2968, partial [Chaetothyriales sp. CBS 132003]